MYAPRHRRFATGLVHGEVQYFAHTSKTANSTRATFKVQDMRMRSKK